MRLLPLLLLAACAGPTEPRVVQRSASVETIDVDTLILTKRTPRTAVPVDCEMLVVPQKLVVDGVVYVVEQIVLVC